MTMSPYRETIERSVPAVTIAATVGNPIDTVTFAATVTSVQYIPQATITGANTDTRKVELVNRGAAGAGTTVVAMLQFNSAINAAAYDAKTITLSATAANLVLAEGDVLEWRSTAVGNGLADPGGVVRIEIDRTG